MSIYPKVQLGELCNVSIGRTPRRNDLRYWGGPHPWATIRDLDGGTLTATKQSITDVALDEVMPEAVEPNTLLFSFKLSIGKIAFAGRKMHHNEAIAALPVRNPEVLDREFLFYALKARTHEWGANHAVLGKVLNKRKVKEIEIPLPPLAEQRRIVVILNRAAKIERLREQARERLGEFIPALFNKMFRGGGMSFPVVQLGDLCLMDRQGIGPDDSAAAGLPFVGVENVESQNGIINFANDSRVGSQKSTTFRFDERHILYAKLRPYLNKVATPDFAGRCSTELVPLLPRDGVVREFIAHLLRRKQTVKYVMASVTGSRMPRTDMKALMLLPVPIPPLDEQRRFARIVDRARAMGALAENGSATASALSASLMSRLLI